MLTQPLMYKKIGQHPARASCTATSWWRRACCRGGPDEFVKAFRAAMDARQTHRRPGADQLQEQVRRRLGALPRQRSGPTRPTPRFRSPRSSAWPSASPRCPRSSRCIRWSKRCWPTAPPWAAARSTSTGAWASTSRSPRWCQRLRGAPVGRGLRPRHLRTATRCCTTRTARTGTRAPTSRCRTSPTTRRRSS